MKASARHWVCENFMRAVYLILALLVLAARPVTASDDVQLWLEAGVRYQISEQFRLKFDQHIRFHENVSAVESIMPELSVSYTPLKFLSLDVGYRFIAEPFDYNDKTYIESWHRFFADIRLKYRIKPVTLDYRLGFQEQFGFPWDKGEKLTTTHTVRNKVGLCVKAPAGFEPFLSAELFNRIDDADGPWHKWRLATGLKYEISSHELSLSYRFEQFIGPDRSDDRKHIVAAGYHYKF